MNKMSIKIFMAALCATIGVVIHCQSHFGDRYEWGKVYAEKERLKDEIDSIHTEDDLADWQQYQCYQCSVHEEDEE